MNTETLKQLLIDFGVEHVACSSEMSRLRAAESIDELLKVVTDNFNWVSERMSVAELLKDVAPDDLANARIYISGRVSVSDGEIGRAHV